MTRWHRWRMTLAKRIAGPDYLVIAHEDFETLLDIQATAAVMRAVEPVAVVPALFVQRPTKGQMN